jgi:CheY-like chemotaxis protein
MVFLVDDDEDDVDFVREALVTYSYKGPVDTAQNGKILMEKLRFPDNRPDVIVMDLNMPVKNGFDTLKEMRTNPTFEKIPVIILTASSNTADEMRCFDLGCSFFYRKPVNLKDYLPLVSMVKKLMSKSSG